MSSSAQTSQIRFVYLGLAVIGAVTTWTYNIQWMLEQQRAMTASEFLTVGFSGSALLGSLASDFWVGWFASVIFMVIEGRRLQMQRIWVYVVLTFVIAWAFALPLFLFVRESVLSRERVDARLQPAIT